MLFCLNKHLEIFLFLEAMAFQNDFEDESCATTEIFEVYEAILYLFSNLNSVNDNFRHEYQ